jgi:hypothetical protein
MKKLHPSAILTLRATPLAASTLSIVEGGASAKPDKEAVQERVDALERALGIPKKNIDDKDKDTDKYNTGVGGDDRGVASPK